MLVAHCPECDARLEMTPEFACGIPNEIGQECDCGAIPVWQLQVEIEYHCALGDYLHNEREWAEKI